MDILESIKVLETKVDKEIDFAKQIIDENTQLKEKVALSQKRIEDLEALVQAFKEEQSAIEQGLLAALNRFNQLEDVVEKKMAAPSSPDAAMPADETRDEPPEERESDLSESDEG